MNVSFVLQVPVAVYLVPVLVSKFIVYFSFCTRNSFLYMLLKSMDKRGLPNILLIHLRSVLLKVDAKINFFQSKSLEQNIGERC